MIPVIVCINGGLVFAEGARSISSRTKNETSLCEGSVVGRPSSPRVISSALEARPAPSDAVGSPGGARWPAIISGPRRIDAALLDDICSLRSPSRRFIFRPSSQAIDAVAAHFPDAPQVVCFDTAFHRDLPEVAQRLPLPRALVRSRHRRYGFHGLSYEYVVETLGSRARNARHHRSPRGRREPGRARDGRPIDTTMGLTPAGGIYGHPTGRSRSWGDRHPHGARPTPRSPSTAS